MILFKYIILCFIFFGCTSIGFMISKKYKERERELLELENLVGIIQNKIKFTKAPINEILDEISKINIHSNISKFFLNVSEKILEQKTQIAWENTINEYREILNLKEEDYQLIKNLGNALGKTDVEGQMNELEQFNSVIKINIKNATKEKEKNEKMHRSLGTIVGLALVIILF